jgi:2-keto-4-pentenoate hydratase
MSVADDVADRLMEARRSRTRLSSLPEHLMPRDRDEAYRIQDALIGRLGEVGAWKIAANGEFPPICSPLPATTLVADGGTMSIAENLLTIAEVEVGVVLGRDLPPRAAPYTGEEIRAAIAGLVPIIEIIGARFEPGSVPANATMADLHQNAAIVKGPLLKDWQGLDLSKLTVTLTIGGSEVARTDKGPSAEAVVKALMWLADNAARRHHGLKAGQVIITGSRVLNPVGKPGDLVEGRVEGLGSVTLKLT